MTINGQFHWNELMTHDVGQAKELYAECVGWSFDEMPMADGGSYWIAMTAGGPAGGIFEMRGPEHEGVPDHWISYLHVDAVDAAVDKAVTMGAKVLRSPFDVPGVGRIALLEQPGGARIGWMTPAERE